MRDVNLRVVETMLERGAAGDLDSLRQYISSDFVAKEAESLPYRGEYRGFQGYVDLMTAMFQAWEGLGWEVLQLIADDKSVVVRLILKGSKNGTPFAMSVLEVWDFVDGKVVAATPHYFDTKALADLYQGAA